jgi:hypothetical protein
MARKLLLAALAIVLMLVAAVFGRARAQVLTPSPEDVRFQLLTNEPIASPDRHSVVAGTSALVLKDRRTGQCFVAVTIGSAMGMDRVDCGK